MVLLETLRSCHGDPIFFLLSVYLNVGPRRVLCASSQCVPSHDVLCDPTVANEDAAEMLPRCMRFYCVYLLRF